MENQTGEKINRQRLGIFFSARGSRSTISVTALMVLLAGLWAAKQAGEEVDLQMRLNLVNRAADVAAAFNVLDINKLYFTTDDKEQSRFRRMCDQLRACAEVSGLSRLYVVGLREGQVVSGPESSTGDGQLALPPGTVYKNPDQQNFDVFKTGRPQVWDSFKNKKRTHITAMAPILDPYTGEVLAAVGADAEVAGWQTTVWRAQRVLVWVTLALLVVLLLIDLTLEYFYRHSAQRDERKKHAETLLCAAFMILLTLVLTAYFDQIERAERRHAFNTLAYTEAKNNAEKIYDLRGMLHEMAYYFESSQEVTREEFHAYCDAMSGKSMVEALVWIPAVPDKEASAFAEAVRAKGVPGFSIWQKNKEGRNEPAALRPVYYPALYIEPPSGYQSALGYDLNSEPRRSAAIQETLNTGLASASEPIRFITATNSPKGFFVFLPVQARVQKGLVAIAIRPDRLMAAATQKNRDMNICLFQLREGQEPLFLAGSSDQCGLACWDDADDNLRITVPVFRFGKTYAFRVVPSPAWLAGHPLRHGRTAFGVGLLLTFLISSLTALITNRQIGLEEKVRHRTEELELAQENMMHLNKQNELILTSAAEGILGLDLQGNHSFINPAAAKMLGYEIEELIGKSSHSLWHHSKPDGTRHSAEESKIYAAYRDGNIHHASDEVFWRKDGTSFPVEYDSTPIYEHGQVLGAVVTFTDITERRKAEERMHLLAQHLQTVREEERKRIARELHDDIGQILTAIKIDLTGVEAGCICEGDTKNKIADIQHLLIEGIQSVHTLCRQLRPGALDDLDLSDALEGLMEDWKIRNLVECTMCSDVDDEALSDEVKTAVFRMVQEALTNVSRYAQASKVEINLVADEQAINVTITDNGRGMAPGAADKPTSFGLLGMRERVENLGGELDIESFPGKGTRIEGTIPLSQKG